MVYVRVIGASTSAKEANVSKKVSTPSEAFVRPDNCSRDRSATPQAMGSIAKAMPSAAHRSLRDATSRPERWR